ncbi:uncharacterized protein LOC119639037 [Glossina fuscipes]|uniref:Uncharacterized protein LOC119639037 n=1 Tax=Glossina fuscipes TaxID=7396 RepID=A0A9C5Z512_9MUSC|nr:uncharacterized protein LOC119639037 [Glossina fuscipes]
MCTRQFILLVIISCLTLHYSSQVNISNHTILRPIVDRIFLRKRRWLLFPKGSSLKFTVFVSKRLLALYPKGFSLNIEAATYYPMPTSRIDLLANQFHKPSSVMGADKNVLIATNLTKHHDKLSKLYNITEPQWLPKKPYYASDYQKLFLTKMKLKNKSWSSKKYAKNIYKKNYSEYQPKYIPERGIIEQSHHYYNVRERRDLFHHFEGFSKFLHVDIKSCILRAICDSKKFLKFPGYSLLHDVLRIFFSFPTKYGLDDDYSNIIDSDYDTCAGCIYDKCPFSILDMFMSSENNIIKKK